MRRADRLLDDEQLIGRVFEAGAPLAEKPDTPTAANADRGSASVADCETRSQLDL
jgi:hypothetical protein